MATADLDSAIEHSHAAVAGILAYREEATYAHAGTGMSSCARADTRAQPGFDRETLQCSVFEACSANCSLTGRVGDREEAPSKVRISQGLNEKFA